MNPYNLFNKKNNKTNEVEFLCPSCGHRCIVSDEFCSFCSYELNDYKKNILLPYKYFNEAIESSMKEDYISALILISKFLAYYPDDEEGNQFYIYLLYKNNFLDKYKKSLNDFEKKFVRHPWIIQVEENGIESYSIPTFKCSSLDFEINSFSNLILEYTSYRTKNIKDIVNLINDFYDIVRICKNKTNNTSLDIIKFYETNFLKFISNREINLENHNGKLVDEMTNEDMQNVEIICKIEDSKKKDNTVVTIYPAIYLRKALISKEKIGVVVNNNKSSQVKSNKKVKKKKIKIKRK